jgi:hypothetical protein
MATRDFALDRTMVVEGDIQELRYANPHVVIRLREADSTVCVVTWESATWLKRTAGVVKTTFKVGDHVIVTAAPSKDPTSHELASVREVLRPRDGIGLAVECQPIQVIHSGM